MTQPSDRPAPAARRRRLRTTSPRVLLVDRAARAGITFGGIAVIAAVLAILVYLGAVVTPLFMGAEVLRENTFTLLTPQETPGLLFAEVDEYRMAGMAALASGEAVYFASREGQVLGRERIFPEDPTATAWSSPAAEGRFAIGFSDGAVRTGQVRFETRFGSAGEDGLDGAVVRSFGTETRRVRPKVQMDDPLPVGDGGSPVVLLDYRPGESETRLALLTGAGEVLVHEVVKRRSLRATAGQAQVVTTHVPLPAAFPVARARFLLLATRGDQMYMADNDGQALRFDLRDPANPAVVQWFDLTPGTGDRLTSLRFTPGEQSILAGDSSGMVRAWFRVGGPGGGGDGYTMVPAHVFGGHGSPALAIAGSARDKSFLTGYADGMLALRHLTSERLLASFDISPPGEVILARITPKGDGAMAVTADGRAGFWRVRNPHPETSWRALFGRMWYEGYPAPGYTWQSSSGTDDFEPKLSLIPLIFGTLKATLYSMLFAVPIALAAAIYTSEFLDRRTRAGLKPLIEMMASLPSVVLGFIAALVLAPLVESWVVAVLCLFAVVPLAALTAGYVWQALPRALTLRLSGDARLVALLLLCLGALLLAAGMARPAEAILFEGDFKAWLSGQRGTAAPGAGILAWPLILVGLLVLDQRRSLRAGRGAGPSARAGLARFLVILVLSVALACVFGIIAEALGFDPRGPLVGSYVQRNALVVGFVMGFAVIPIIYTIAEDALSAVPHTLRSASLGCGATPWQTAVRVVLPVALSGIFSAIMVGLGRAVGETMIVLMAAGNTPLMEMNVFSGLRTLSANIAVELPEASKDGTLYRVLFLAALILFLITFAVNTVAEIIRQRFRKRAFQL